MAVVSHQLKIKDRPVDFKHLYWPDSIQSVDKFAHVSQQLADGLNNTNHVKRVMC